MLSLQFLPGSIILVVVTFPESYITSVFSMDLLSSFVEWEIVNDYINSNIEYTHIKKKNDYIVLRCTRHIIIL